MPTPHFGQSLRATIEEQGVSIRVAANQIGVAHPQLLRWLNKKQIPKQETLERIAKGLGIPVTKLLPPKIQRNLQGLEAKVNALEAQLVLSNEELNRIRGIILNVTRAETKLQERPGDHQNIQPAKEVWRGLFLEGMKIERAKMLGAIEGILPRENNRNWKEIGGKP